LNGRSNTGCTSSTPVIERRRLLKNPAQDDFKWA
jgi:hypothetical protein